jgi:uncharacterized membrane protein YeaQ/YmgE (transglycosylase-associated protein family)
MGLLAWIIFGALAGWIASMFTGNNAEQGALGNIFFGIIGAFVGGFIVQVLGGNGLTGFNVYSMLVAIGGAIVVLTVKNSLTRG